MNCISFMRLACLATAMTATSSVSVTQAAERPADGGSREEFLGEERKSKGPILYAEVSGARILALVNEARAQAFAEKLQQQTEVVRALVPAEYRTESSAPRLFIVDGAEPPASAMLGSAIALLQSDELPTQSSGGSREQDASTWTPGTWTGPVEPGEKGRRVVGAVSALDDMDECAWYLSCLPGETPHFLPPALGDALSNTVSIAPWARDSLERVLARGEVTGGRLRVNFTLRSLDFSTGNVFSAQVPTVARSNSDESVWTMRILLTLWALSDGEPSRAAGFWQLAHRSATESVTEQLLRETLGVDYDGLQAELKKIAKRYGEDIPVLSWIMLKREIPVMKPVNLPKVKFRAATRGQLVSVESEWERLSALRLRRNRDLDEVPQILERASRRLEREGPGALKDPTMSAVLGLIECDRGNDTKARPYLEEAAAAKVARARVYYELARIQSRDAINAAPSTGLISDEQANAVLASLRAGYSLRPVVVSLHGLAVGTALRVGRRLTPDELALVAASARAEPRQTAFTYRAALVFAREGRIEEAKALADLALTRASGQETPSIAALKQALERGTEIDAVVGTQIGQIIQR